MSSHRPLYAGAWHARDFSIWSLESSGEGQAAPDEEQDSGPEE